MQPRLAPLLSALLLAGSALLAGCSGGGDVEGPGRDPVDSPQPFVNPAIVGHEHGELATHRIANGVELVGRDLMGEQGPPGYPGEIHIAGNLSYVALLGYGFAIVDLSDPADPEVVSSTALETPSGPLGYYVADIKTDDAGDWVFLGMQASATPGVLIYDARDRSAPTLAGYWLEPGTFLGCHMVEYAAIAGQEYLFCGANDDLVHVGLLLPPTPTGQRIVQQVATWAPHDADTASREAGAAMGGLPFVNRLLTGHQDMTYQPDPLTGTPMLMVSLWNLGVHFVDVSIPAAPRSIGSWGGEGSGNYTGLIHTTMAFESEGRRIVVSIPEVAVPPKLFVLDATDYAEPVLLGEWQAIPDFDGEDTTFSLHNFQVVDGKVYLSMYHGGLWVLDVSTNETRAAPQVLGTYMPTEPSASGEDYYASVWDVVVWNGYMVTADGSGGLYVVHYEGDPAGDPEHTGFA